MVVAPQAAGELAATLATGEPTAAAEEFEAALVILEALAVAPRSVAAVLVPSTATAVKLGKP